MGIALASSTQSAHIDFIARGFRTFRPGRRLIGRKTERDLSEAEHSHRSGTQLAHWHQSAPRVQNRSKGVPSSGVPPFIVLTADVELGLVSGVKQSFRIGNSNCRWSGVLIVADEWGRRSHWLEW